MKNRSTSLPNQSDCNKAIDITGDVHGSVVIAGSHNVVNLNREIYNNITTGTLLQACQTIVERNLNEARYKYDPNLYVHREIETSINGFVDFGSLQKEIKRKSKRTAIRTKKRQGENLLPHCYLIVSPAGSGKTNLVSQIAKERMNTHVVVLLTGGTVYLGDNGLADTIRNEINYSSNEISFKSAWDCINVLHIAANEIGNSALIIIDGINEYNQPFQMKKALETLISKTRGKNIKIIISCRDYYWGVFKGNFWKGQVYNLEATDVSSSKFNLFENNEHIQALSLYFEHYNIAGKPIGEAVEQCRHPLLLRFLCEAYSGQEIGEIANIRLKQLFDKYWDQKLESLAERMVNQGHERVLDGLKENTGAYLLQLARYMFVNNVRAIPVKDISKATDVKEDYNDPKSTYGRIRDEYIVLEEKEFLNNQDKQIAFVYEEFMEYAIARSLIKTWNEKGFSHRKITSEIGKIAKERKDKFLQIFGVLVYLALMLKEEKNIWLWSNLIRKQNIVFNDQKWVDVIFESFKKLPAAMLDQEAYTIMEDILVMGDQTSQINAMKVLCDKRIVAKIPESTIKLICKKANSKAVRDEKVISEALISIAALPLVGESWGLAIRAISTHFDTEFRLTALQSLETLSYKEPQKVSNAFLEKFARFVEKFATRLYASEKIGRDQYSALSKVLQVLLIIGETAPIQSILQSDYASQRLLVIKILQSLNSNRIASLAAGVLEDKSNEVLCAALETLGSFPDQKYVPALIAKLSCRNAAVRYQTIISLGKIGDTRASRPLVQKLKSVDVKEKSLAVDALSNISDPSIAPYLEKLLNDNTLLSLKAAKSFSKGKNNYQFETVENMYLNPDWRIRKHAVEALMNFDRKKTKGVLIKALNDTVPAIRLSAIESARYHNNITIRQIIRQLSTNDPVDRVRRAALFTLSIKI